VTEARVRVLLAGALVITALGIALAGTVSRDGGGVLIAAGWIALVAALHGFGRAGSDR